MSRLKPGATYIYERVDGITYAREAGAHPGDRFEIGREYDPSAEPTVLGMPIKQVGYWVGILYEAEHNPALQDALERVKMLYELTKESDPETVMWHPV